MSNINPFNINGSYPIAGQSNPSQGFRDNFTNIKNNFATAYSEITDLQNKVVLTSALTGGVVNNNMAGTTLGNVQLTGWTQSLYNLGSVTGPTTVNFQAGNFQTLTTAGSITLGFNNWPASVGLNAVGYATLRLWITVSSASHTVAFPSTVSIGSGDIAGYNPSTYTITFDVAGTYVFDVSSINGGTTYLISDVTRSRASFHDPNFYYNPSATTSPTLFLGYGQNSGYFSSLNLALAGDQGQNILSALGSYNSVSIGNLALGNVQNATLDTGKMAGYTITSARGNLAASTNQVTPIQINDYMGYINVVGYTGLQGTSNTWQQMSSIAFYANGGGYAYGLGSNIAFFTSNGGASSTTSNALVQAMSINSDQSVDIFANLRTGGGIVERGTYYVPIPTAGGTFGANLSTSTIIVDNALPSLAITGPMNILLPDRAPDKFKFRISVLPQVTTANIYANLGVKINYANTTSFSAGNTVVQLTYFAATSTWYRS